MKKKTSLIIPLAFVSMINSVAIADSEESLSEMEREERSDQIREHFDDSLDQMEIVKTTRTESGQIIDWIEPQSQSIDGVLSEPPLSYDSTGALIEYDPDALVPVVRFDVEKYLDKVKTPAKNPQRLFKKRLPQDIRASKKRGSTRSPATNDRYYAVWRQHGTFYGTSGYINIWDTAGPIEGDTSIAQMIVMRGDEAVEAGKIELKGLNGNNEPHFFVFYRGINSTKGYNFRNNAWKQISDKIAPGMSLTSRKSIRGGHQGEIRIMVKLFKGNWWVSVDNEWVGYYRGSLFSASGIRDKASRIDWYGEVYDVSAPSATSTDMGSGKFASEGYKKAAYFRNMASLLNPNTSDLTYWKPESGIKSVTDSSCYSIGKPFKVDNHKMWKNVFYYGGSGKEASGCN